MKNTDTTTNSTIAYTDIVTNNTYNPSHASSKIVRKGRVNLKDKDGHFPLLIAADLGDLDDILQLLNAGADVNAADNDGFTALYRAAGQGHTSVVKVLIEFGANVNQKTNQGSTPLIISLQPNNLDIVPLLLKAGADANAADNDGWTPLHIASTYHSFDSALEELIKFGANVNQKTNKGITPLEVAISNNNIDVANILIREGADINAKSPEYEMSVSYIAAKDGHFAILKKLIESGADINAQDDSGYIGLDSACHNGHVEIVKLLLSSGAVSLYNDVCAKTESEEVQALVRSYSKNPLHYILENHKETKSAINAINNLLVIKKEASSTIENCFSGKTDAPVICKIRDTLVPLSYLIETKACLENLEETESPNLVAVCGHITQYHGEL